MLVLLKKMSVIIERGQVIILKFVCQVLGVEYGGWIMFYVDEDCIVFIWKEVDDDEGDFVIVGFFVFFVCDME